MTWSTEFRSKTPFLALSTVVPALIPSSSKSEIPTSASVPAIGVSDVKILSLNVDMTEPALPPEMLQFSSIFSSERKRFFIF